MNKLYPTKKNALFIMLFLSLSYSLIAQDFNIQHIQDDIGNSGGTNTSFTPVSSLNSAFALPTNNRKTHAGRSDSNDGDLEGDDMAGARVLTATNTLTYYRESGSISADMRFNTSIWEYTGAPSGANEFIVRGRFAVDLSSANFADIDLSSSGIVDPNKCIPFITGIMNDDTDNGGDSATGIAHLDSATNLKVRRGTNFGSSNVTIYITLVEFTGSNWTVLHGNMPGTGALTGAIPLFDGYDATGTLSSVSDWSNAIIFGHSKAQTAATGGEKEKIRSQWPIMGPGADNQNVQWTFDATRVATGNSNRHFVHVLNNPEITVTRFTDTSFADDETTIDITSAGLLATNQSMALGTSITAGDNTDYGQGYRNYYLNSIMEAAHWCHRSGSSLGITHNLQIIDFSSANSNPGPGGIATGLQLWLKADFGIEEAASDNAENLDPVLNWLDSSTNNNDATQATLLNRPIFNENAMNFNPMVNFDGTNHELLATITPNTAMTLFAVAQGTFNTTKHLLNINAGGSGSVVLEKTSATAFQSRYYDGTAASGQVSATIADGDPFLMNYDFVSDLVGGTTSEFFNKGDSQGTASTNAYTLPATVTAGIGTHPTNTARRWNGNIAELIVLNRSVGPDERNQIESYLAIKYGITLGINGVSQDYVDSDNTTIWDQSEDSGAFNYNVTGIGRDDASGLNQKQSRTVHTTDDIVIGVKEVASTNSANTNTFFADKTFLVWGNDNGATTADTPIAKDYGSGTGVVTNVSFTPIERIWKVVVKDSVPTVKLTIPESMVTSTIGTGGAYIMAVSDDPTFTTNVTSVTMDDTGINLEVDFYFEGTKYVTFGYAEEVTLSRAATFNGTDQYLDAGDVNDLNGTDFTISAWVKRDSGEDKFDIVSKRNYFNENLPSDPGPDNDGTYTHGYAFRINSTGQFRVVWRDPSDSSNNVMQTSQTIPENEWHHICATFTVSTGTANLYIDGFLEDTDTGLDPIDVPSDSHFLIGAAHHIKRQQRTRGSIDEVRVWDVALSADQIRYIMNQEIQNNSNFVDGKVIPTSITKNEIIPIPWANLIAYYPMSTFVFGSVKDESNSGNDASMINYDNIDNQTAPLPYITTQDGDWDTSSTWQNGNVQYLPGVASYLDANETIDFNIVQIDHNVTLSNTNATLIPSGKNGNRTMQAIVVSASGDLQLDGDTAAHTGNALTVTHYLKLDGTIDLEGESQLIQTTDSDFDPTSSGALERDQQGTADTYTYNYWSSPVGEVNTTTNNNSYSLPDVFSNVTFLTSGFNGTSTPLGIADYWIFKFNNLPAESYADWQHVRSTGTILAGEGFTMKGPGTGSILTDQNYIIQGKPNNGDISLAINSGNEYLVGNPYPSAIDANQFILDNGSTIANAGATTGTLYFWEHWGGASHNSSDYQGGYATYSLAGGTPSASMGASHPGVGTGGAPTKIPGRYIPVAQGFFVTAETTGNIVFNNAQRVFEKEGSSSSIFVKASSTKKALVTNTVTTDERTKIRLGLNSTNNLHRQLLATVDENTTIGFDWGYDAPYNDDQIDDMYWMIDNNKYVIQGINTIDEDIVLPIGLHTKTNGLNSITIDKLENFPNSSNIYLHDKDLGVYHDLKQSDYSIYLSAGEYLNRFEITFKAEGTLTTETHLQNTIAVYFSKEKERLVIQNSQLLTINTITIFNLLGQPIKKFKHNFKEMYTEHGIPNINEGAYIVKMKTEKGLVSKKILIE